MNSSLLKNLKSGNLQIGTIMTLPAPEIAEILVNCGFDWLFIDLEHSVMDIKDLMRIIQSVEAQIPCVVRVPALDEIWIKKVLDIGASGVIIPQIQTADEAEKAAVPLGIFGVDSKAVKTYINEGYSLIAVGLDTMIFQNAAGKIRKEFT